MIAKRSVSFLLLALLISCSAVQVKPGAERVIVSRTAAPQGCKFISTVTGSQGGALSGPFTSNRTMAEGAMNDLKNKAFDAGANYVVLETNQAGNTMSGGAGTGGGGEQTDVTNVGNAYKCPPELIGLN